MSQSSAHVILYSRSYCHLCDDMLEALQRLSDTFSFTIKVVDVDLDERLVAQYDELVPVLVGVRDGMPVEICHYFLDDARLKEFFAGVLS